MTNLEKAALAWYDTRKAFIDVDNGLGTPEFRTLLNETCNSEHTLADAVRKHRTSLKARRKKDVPFTGRP